MTSCVHMKCMQDLIINYSCYFWFCLIGGKLHCRGGTNQTPVVAVACSSS